MNNILIIVYYFPPIGGGGVERPLKFVKYLNKNGYAPYVLTVKKGYSAIFQNERLLEECKGINIIRTFSPEFAFFKNLFLKKGKEKSILQNNIVSENKKSKRNILAFFKSELRKSYYCIDSILNNYFLIPDKLVLWSIPAFFTATKIIKKYNISTVLTSSPPNTCQLIGLLLKKYYKDKIKWISDFRDPWYQSDKDSFKIKISNDLSDYIKDQVLKKADLLTTISSNCNKYIFANKGSVITNGFDYDDIKKSIKSNFKGFNIIYSGFFYETKNSKIFVDAIEELFEDNKYLSEEIFVRFIGSKRQNWIRDYLAKSQYKDNFIFYEFVDKNKCISLLRGGDIFLTISYEDSNYALPGKTFNYLLLNKPILALNSMGDLKDLIEKTNTGIATTDKTKIKNFILDVYNNKYDYKSDKIEIEKYDREKLTGKLIEEIEKLNEQ